MSIFNVKFSGIDDVMPFWAYLYENIFRNYLTSLRENFFYLICFWTKKTTQQQNKNPCRSRELNPGTSHTQSGCVTSAPPSQLRVTFVVKLFNYFDAIGGKVNKQSRICGPHIYNKFIFSVIFLHDLYR